MSEATQWQVQRVPTGVPNLDCLIDGGLTQGSLLCIVGGPGAGKTVLAEQMAFHWAAQGKNTLWVVTLGEANEKFLTHLSEMRFYDRRRVGAEIQLVNLARFLQQGLEEKMAVIRETLHSGNYSFLVIDGFQGLRCFLDGQREVRFFLSELSSEMALAGTTLIVTADSDPRRHWEAPEFTVADCIMFLDRVTTERREQRRLQVLKLRGRSAIGGPHSLSIDASGIHIHPRIESIFPSGKELEGAAREPFELPSLDRMMNGGPLEATATLVMGSPGTGKSILADHFLAAGLRRGEPCLQISFFESVNRQSERSDSFGLPLRQGREAGLLQTWSAGPEFPDPDSCAEDIRRAVEERGVRRLVIDGIDPIEHQLLHSHRSLAYLAALVGYLRMRGVTTLLTCEVASLPSPSIGFRGPVVSQVVANLILLRFQEHQGRLRRVLSIVKMRYSEHSTDAAELVLAEGRAAVVPAADMAEREPI